MNRIRKNVGIFIVLLILFAFMKNTLYATTINWWDKAGSFFSGAAPTSISSLDELKSIIQAVGNMIFIVATVILGIKYIYGGAESKSSVTDSLITLVVAAIAFYSWTTIESIFINSDKLVFITGSAEDSAKNIYRTILYICNYVAIGGIVYIGVKYMLAGADGRAALKAKSVPIILGIVMVYATITFLNIAVSIVK